MIDPHWLVSDLDPLTWRNLGPYLEPQNYIAAAQPDEHGLFILHHAGHVLRVVDTQTEMAPPHIPLPITDPVALAQSLYAQGRWDRVHVIDRRHLAWVAQQAQVTPRRELTLDAYYHLVYGLVWGDPQGYACVPAPPGHWNGWTYADVQGFMARITAPATVALGVYADEQLTIGLILVCEMGRIRRVTTFEGLRWKPTPPFLTPHNLATFYASLTAQFAPPAFALLCTASAFTGWLAASDKGAYLLEARERAQAMWNHT